MKTHIDKLHEVARILFENEKIDADEFKNIMERQPLTAESQPQA